MQDAREMQEELDTARKERSAMEKQLETLKKVHEHTAEYKRQTIVYLKRYETQIAALERDQKELVKENAELRRAARTGRRLVEADHRSSDADAQAAAAAAAAAKARVDSLSKNVTALPSAADSGSNEPAGHSHEKRLVPHTKPASSRGEQTNDTSGALAAPTRLSESDEEAVSDPASSAAASLPSVPAVPSPRDRQFSAGRRATTRERSHIPSHGPAGGMNSDSDSDSARGSPETERDSERQRETERPPDPAVSIRAGGRAAAEAGAHKMAVTAAGFSDASSIMSMESTGAGSTNTSVSDGSNW